MSKKKTRRGLRIKPNKSHRQHRSPNRSSRKIRIKRKSVAPRTLKQYNARSRKFQEEWNRAVQVTSQMRSQGLSLSQASKQVGISPRKVLRLVGSAVTKSGKRYKIKHSDRLLRVLLIPSENGLREIVVNDSQQASLIGKYWSAVEKYLARGDASALERLPRKTVKDADGKRVRLLLDLDALRTQAAAGVLHFESLYGRRT